MNGYRSGPNGGGAAGHGPGKPMSYDVVTIGWMPSFPAGFSSPSAAPMPGITIAAFPFRLTDSEGKALARKAAFELREQVGRDTCKVYLDEGIFGRELA